MKYKVGDRVQIKSLDWYNENKDKDGNIFFPLSTMTKAKSEWCGKVMTILSVYVDFYRMEEMELTAINYWIDEMIEGLVEEETKPKFKVGEVVYNNAFNEYVRVTSIDGVHCYVIDLKNNTTHYAHINNLIPISEVKYMKLEINLPQDYQFIDENGNVISATKIVLEKKKKEYPKTYEECCEILGCIAGYVWGGYKGDLFKIFHMLYICREAYWKLYGEEIGLDKPWEPDWSDCENIKYIIGGYGGEIDKGQNLNIHITFAFPTAEMRDAFYENFKSDIESCKELL